MTDQSPKVSLARHLFLILTLACLTCWPAQRAGAADSDQYAAAFACLASPFADGCGMGSDSNLVQIAQASQAVTTNPYDPNSNMGKIAQQYFAKYGTYGYVDVALGAFCQKNMTVDVESFQIIYNACLDSARAASATAGLDVAGAGKTYVCETCFIPANLVDIGNRYMRLIWTGSDPGGGSAGIGFAFVTAQAARILLMFSIVWIMASYMIVPTQINQVLTQFARTLVVSVGVALALGLPAGGRLVFEGIFDLLQNTGLAIANFTLSSAHASQGWNTVGGVATVDYKSVGWDDKFCSWVTAGSTCVTASYADLWGQAELSILPLLKFLGGKLTANGVLNGSVFGVLILAAPFVFVLGVFGAFLIQSSFYFLAMTIAMPIAFMVSIHPAGKGYVSACLRIMVTAALT
ncbi:hypothetical protein, partial [Azospirillum sp. B4]|uniref:hypothetical protein n=1 Tax=Azospirillum sp. B4 TaxID=95605 RepID=UPI0005C7F94A